MNTPRPVSKFTGSKVGRLLMQRLDSWKPWVVVLAAGLIAVNVWTLTIYRGQARDEATHAAEIVASADGQYTSCVGSIPVLKKINGFIIGARVVDEALVRNSRANLAATPIDSPLYTVRAGNLNRLRAASAAAAQVRFPVPTRSTCNALRDRLLKSQ